MKTQQHTCMPTIYKVSIHCTPFVLIRTAILLGIKLLSSSRTFCRTLYQDVRSYTILGRLVLHYTTLHIPASTSLLSNTEVGYHSLSSLYSKFFLWNYFLANSLTISEQVFLYIQRMF